MLTEEKEMYRDLRDILIIIRNNGENSFYKDSIEVMKKKAKQDITSLNQKLINRIVVSSDLTNITACLQIALEQLVSVSSSLERKQTYRQNEQYYGAVGCGNCCRVIGGI